MRAVVTRSGFGGLASAMVVPLFTLATAASNLLVKEAEWGAKFRL